MTGETFLQPPKNNEGDSSGRDKEVYGDSGKDKDVHEHNDWNNNFHDDNEWDNDDVITAPVPEPETYAMMLIGLGLLGFMTRRKNG